MARGPVTQHVKAASMSGMGSSSHCLTCAFTAKDKIVTRFREELFSPNMRQRTTQWQDSNPRLCDSRSGGNRPSAYHPCHVTLSKIYILSLRASISTMCIKLSQDWQSFSQCMEFSKDNMRVHRAL